MSKASKLDQVNQVRFSLFDNALMSDIESYLPDSSIHYVEFAAAISGRMLEEQVELHLASGGTPLTAMGHVADAITNECFKKYKEVGQKGGANQEAYPSTLNPGYNEDEVITELADSFIQWNLNRLNSGISLFEIHKEVLKKMEKLDTARKNGKLIRTTKGTVYIKKD